MRGATLSLKGRALKYLAAREHSRAELIRKLSPHAESIDEVERTLDELESKGFLSAERFVESVVHRKAARYGSARLKAELVQHQLPDDLTRSVLNTLKETEFERARALWLKRFGEPPSTPADRAKQVRFLAGRGFSGEVIRQVLKGQDAPD
ncbi:MAG: recombination regulator RecX [Burkholderiales bacterium]|nr:recombination regulator RecX [Burkholderiales bacterium]MDE2434303.1 recombination regulator RecX [Burkholderiales bacterium]HET8694688.1 recombination regulator RecX [Aquabacterium sp.]